MGKITNVKTSFDKFGSDQVNDGLELESIQKNNLPDIIEKVKNVIGLLLGETLEYDIIDDCF